jgi:hypothetical protein
MTVKAAVKGEAEKKNAIYGNVASSDDPCGYLSTGQERKVESAKQKSQNKNRKQENKTTHGSIYCFFFLNSAHFFASFQGQYVLGTLVLPELDRGPMMNFWQPLVPKC